MSSPIPPWLERAFAALVEGVREIPGPDSHPAIARYLAGVALHPIDEIPWCAAFVNDCLDCGLEGVAGTGRANARSYLGWGFSTTPRLGSICALWRGSPNAATGHVAFYLDGNAQSVFLIGGNQGDRVSIAAFPRTQVLGHRWPSRVA